jgi:hypothetical protein
MKIKKYWWKFREWKPKIIEVALVFIVISLLAGIANQKGWLFPLIWIEGNGVNSLDLLSGIIPQLMILKRVFHKDYDDPS